MCIGPSAATTTVDSSGDWNFTGRGVIGLEPNTVSTLTIAALALKVNLAGGNYYTGPQYIQQVLGPATWSSCNLFTNVTNAIATVNISNIACGALNLYGKNINIQGGDTIVLNADSLGGRCLIPPVQMVSSYGGRDGCVPLWYSCLDLDNVTGQAWITGSTTGVMLGNFPPAGSSTNGPSTGTFAPVRYSTAFDRIILAPLHGAQGFTGTGYVGLVFDVFNGTLNPLSVYVGNYTIKSMTIVYKGAYQLIK